MFEINKSNIKIGKYFLKIFIINIDKNFVKVGLGGNKYIYLCYDV